MKRALLLCLVLASAACAPKRGDEYLAARAAAGRAYDAGRFAEAAAKYDEAAKQAKVPRDAVLSRYEAALARLRAGDPARAQAELRQLAKEQNAYSGQAAFKAAEITMATDPDAAYRELEELAAAFPTDGVAEVAIMKIAHHDDEAGPEKALAHLEQLAARVKTKDGGSGAEQTIAYERAKRLEALGRNDAAHDAYLAVAAKWPYPFGSYLDDSLFHAADLEEKAGRHADAIATLERLLSYREESAILGSYERPKYVPAILKIADIQEKSLHDRAAARATLHRLYTQFTHSTLRDDALWREAELWREDGDNAAACDRLSTLAHDFPDSKYVPCATSRCPSIKRPDKSKAPASCHSYILRSGEPGTGNQE